MNERKLRLEVLQGDDGGDCGISRVPRWQPTGQDAMITNDITGSVMKIRVTDSSGKLISIVIGKNGTIQEVKDEQMERTESLNQHDGTRMICDENVSENNPQGKLGSDGTMGESCNVDLSLVKEEIEVEDPGPSEPYTDLVGVVSEGYNDVATPMDPPAEEQDQKPMETDLEDKKTPEMILTDKIKTEDTEMAGQFETVFVDPSTVENDETTEQNSELSNIIFETNEHGIGMPIFCRLCATRDDDMIDIFGMDQVYRNIVDHYLPVTVKTSDYLPKKACRSCIAKVTQFHNFYETVADAQKQFSMLEEKILSQIKNLKNYPKVIPQCNGQLAPNENSELEFIIKPIDPPPPKCYGPVTRARKKPGDLVEPVEEKKKTDCLDGETDIIKCRICGRFFGTPKSCYSHSRVHACNGYVPCSMCDEIFTNRKDAHIHSWDHILPLTTQKVREMMKKKLNDLKLNTVKNVKGMIYVIEENRKAEEEAIKNSGVRCRICSEVFLNTRACYRHSISHAQENYHPCCMCNKNFTSKTEALVHSLEHVTYSSAPRTKPKPIKRLVKRATIVKKISPDPDLEKYLTNRNVKLIDNVTQNEDDGDDDRDMVKCRLCGLYFGTGKSCYAHSAVHNSENYYPCSMCEASFTNKKDSYTHSIKHTANKVHQRRAEMIRRNGYIEPVTPVARIIMEQIMEKHGVVEIKRNEQSPSPSDPESDDDMVKCRLCGLYFGTGKSCYTHSAVHFSENYYPCSMCDETFTTRKESYEHSYMHTVTKPQLRMSDMIRQRGTIEPMKVNEDNDVIEINEGESTAQGEAIWCRFCGKFFKSVLSCYKHAKAHYSRRKYPCCMCDKDFTTLGESYVHSLSHQTTRLPLRKSAAEITDGGNVSDEGIQCSVCKIYLKSAASFHSHCYSHISTDNFPCCICDKSFKTDVEYCFHSIRHSSESSGAKEGKISIPICNKCGKRFPTDDRLKFHKIYHDPRTKPCYCRRCDKNFASESSLYDHIQTVHTEPTGEFGRKRTREEPNVSLATKVVYECIACKCRFDSHEKLKTHKLTSCTPSDTQKLKNHECSHCGKTFFRKNILMLHEQSHVSEESSEGKNDVETPLKCSKCEKTFPNLGALRNHAVLHAALKPFACYKCHKSFKSEEARKEHTEISHKDASIDCDICGQNFLRISHLEKHKTVWHNNNKKN